MSPNARTSITARTSRTSITARTSRTANTARTSRTANTARTSRTLHPSIVALSIFASCTGFSFAESLSEMPGVVEEARHPSDHPRLLGPEVPSDAIAIARSGTEDDAPDVPVEIRRIVYDVSTREEFVFQSRYRDGLDEEPRTVPEGTARCAPDEVSGPEGGGAVVFGADGRDEIQDPVSTPWNRIGKVYAWFHDPDDDPDSASPAQEVQYADCVGTGALIGACHVLTAGHVIYNHDPQCGNIGWADKVIFVPGLYTDAAGTVRWPYGSQYATRLMSFQGWTQDEDEDHDMGFFVLDADIGNTIGWFGYSTRDSDGEVRNISGYPGDLNNGLDQFHMADDVKCENTYNLKYKIDTAGGQSGAPIWEYDGVNRYVVGVHAHGGVPFGCGFETENRGVRITSGKFDSIQDWKAENDCPVGAPDLGDDGGDDDDGPFDDLVITAERIPLCFLLRNFGLRPAARFRVGFFLSYDDEVTRDDVPLGVAVVEEGLRCFERTVVKIDVRIPPDTRPGVYYLGWFIDIDRAVDESNEDDNRGVLLSKEIEVLGASDVSIRERVREVLRGDANDDSRFDISDPLKVVGHLFLGDGPPNCLRAADNNEDDVLDLSDAIDALTDLFLGPSMPRECAERRAPRPLSCVRYSHCQ